LTPRPHGTSLSHASDASGAITDGGTPPWERADVPGDVGARKAEGVEALAADRGSGHAAGEGGGGGGDRGHAAVARDGVGCVGRRGGIGGGSERRVGAVGRSRAVPDGDAEARGAGDGVSERDEPG